MLRLAYSVFFAAGMVILSPYYLKRLMSRGNAWEGFGERFGVYREKHPPIPASGAEPIWIHAVSVGEVKIAEVLIREIRSVYRAQPIVLTVTTTTARQIARCWENRLTRICYNPVDLGFCVENFFERFRPKALVLIEQEIWPQYLWEAERRRTPVFLVNARLSPKSQSRMQRIRPIMARVLSKLSWVGIQHEDERVRFARTGFPHERLFLMGSAKYDVAELSADANFSEEEIRQKIGWKSDDPVIFGGSTFPGEEEILLEQFSRIKKEMCNLKLVLAPRHFERKQEVLEHIRAAGLSCALRSETRHLTAPVAVSPEVLLLDTTGELAPFYALGTVIFVGKSITAKGGQNFLEAIRHSKPVVVGPNMQNFQSITRDFLDVRGIELVPDAVALGQTIERLLRSPHEAADMAEAGFRLYRENLGAIRQTALSIMSSIK